jgi:uncharacterized membrane protein YgdD (TMEM256/DUF423 family)
MIISFRHLSVVGAVALAVAVGLDAWHAHGLKDSLDAHAYQGFARGLQQNYTLGLALLISGLRLSGPHSKLHRLAGVLFLLAMLLFCGDVYSGALGGPKFGVAPMGGSLHILAWLVFAGAEIRQNRPNSQ